MYRTTNTVQLSEKRHVCQLVGENHLEFGRDDRWASIGAQLLFLTSSKSPYRYLTLFEKFCHMDAEFGAGMDQILIADGI